uniref:Putative Fe-S oxidoreductase n=1 Tax=uncultured marine group II/III euryarchaeote KM3_178_D06 TaxID=1457940 RepID=A0A075GLU5_9EURY|nr:putative Fe-S oxidoreductase [uncultured marine group II/III euryarchaeote KM3_178_D06]
MAADWERTPCLERGCSKCCRETEMPVTRADISRITALGHKLSFFTIVQPDGSVRLANSNETKACVFLTTDSAEEDAPGTCSIWKDRPEGCRIYPLILDELDQPFLDELCPHRDEFSIPPIGMRGRLHMLSDILDGGKI